VHLFGRLCDIEDIVALGEKSGAPVIEDACQAHGARLNGRRAGSFGLASAFSFYPAKNLGAFGDGGMLVTSSPAIADSVRQFRNYGQKAKYEHVSLPLNHRLDTIQAAVLRVKLPHLDRWNARRQYLADAYREHLAELPVRIAPAEVEDRHIYHLFVIETDQRDALKAALAADGIETGIHYPAPLHLQGALKDLGYRKGAFPNAERLAAHSLSLPMYPEMSLEQVERVTSGIRAYFRG
jgi:dTDP-4-amino-4,6-dideoxygalactose transaminase